MSDPKDALDLMVSDDDHERLLELLLAEEGFGAAEEEGIPLADRQGSLPLSFAQQRLWFLGQLDPDSAVYNISKAVRLEGDLDARAMERSLAEILRRHEALRTAFPARDGQPSQAISPAPPAFVLPRVDLSRLAPEGREEELRHLAGREANTPFDLSRAPLVRATLIALAPGEHAIFLTLHHIISDGWSMGVLIRELATLYQACSRGEASSLRPLPVQYADYAAWQRHRLSGEVLAAELAFWRQQLEAVPSVLELPTDRPRPAVATSEGAQIALPLASGSLRRLEELAEKSGGTLFMAVLFLYGTLLSRYSGQPQLLVGTPIAGRLRSEVEGLIGFFVNTLVLPVDLAGRPTVREALGRVVQTVVQAFEHQEVPFEKLIEELRPDRHLSQTPLFQAFLVHQSTPEVKVDFPDLAVSALPTEGDEVKFDLTLTLVPAATVGAGGSGGWIARWSYKTAIFDASTIRRMAGHFHHLIETVTAAPDAPLSRLSLLTPREEQQIISEWNFTETELPVDCLHYRIEEQVRRTPGAVAVVAEGEELTYAELNRRANQLAHHLRSLGVGPEVYVGIFLERTVSMLVGVLGILKAGAAYVPLDTRFPVDRLAFMLEDTEAPVLVTQESLLGELPPHQCQTVLLDRDREILAATSEEDPEHRNVPENPVYVIFTSGSTGRPKGVILEHRRIVNYLWGIRQTMGWEPGSSFAMVQTLAVDSGKTNLYLPLTTGGTVHVLSNERAADAHATEEYFRAHRIDSLKLAPSHLRALQTGPHPADVLPRGWLILGGEPCQRSWAAGLQEMAPGCAILNHYGPTEATVTMLTFRYEEGKSQALMFPIGRPAPNTQAHLLDRHLNPVPAGVGGEIHIAGDCLARGYLKRPRLTAERFIPDPYRPRLHPGRQGERMYKTGDLARYLPDGNVEFLGRVDDQVKIRGFRIELGEVQAAIGRHPLVREVVVLALSDDPSGGSSIVSKRLVAYVVPRKGAELAARTLRVFLGENLPDYMVPSLFVFLEALPRTGHGKLDRKALPHPSQVREQDAAAAADQQLPATEIQRAVAGIWEEVLAVPRVGLSDNFFDLGGHSLLMIRVHSKLRQLFGRDLAVVDLFKYPTVGQLSEFLSRGQHSREHLERGRERARARTAVRKTGRADIAIVGMAGRFPGARDLGEFWRNLERGVESITFFSDEELLARGVDPALLEDPRYVRAKGVLAEPDLFDPAFFEMSAREAQITDPQQRLFLETAWQALEVAGYDPQRYLGRIGVFAGVSLNTYLFHILSHPGLAQELGYYTLSTASKGDYVATRVAYKLGLTGTSINVQSACSTSLVAICLACESLLHHQTDMVLAGGASLDAAGQRVGYVHERGGVLSPDGHCRAFDASGAGTVSGNGVGVVLLKRLEDALDDGDTIHAVIRGFATNNDGSAKVGFTAPGVEGQAQAIAEALTMAGVASESVGYIEAHGTATHLGDPIEVSALAQAFEAAGEPRRGHCLIGSVKTNIGHLDAAAGVAGLIKATLALERGKVPPSLHFEAPNPQIDFAATPFRVAAQLSPWPETGGPRRAGVSSFGLGGTNAHVILEQAPLPGPPVETARPGQLLLLSARTAGALEAMTARLAEHLRQHPEASLADVAYTLQAGRRVFPHRRFLVTASWEEALAGLEAPEGGAAVTAFVEHRERPAVFLFPGGGAQYPGMGRDLYTHEVVFREEIDTCARHLEGQLDIPLLRLLDPLPEEEEEVTRLLRRTTCALPALFATEYALAQLWRSWGIEPEAMIGHSLGEYVAACLAGVLSLENALAMVVTRGRLFDQLAEGAMLSVSLGEAEVRPYLEGTPLDIAALNTPELCAVSGPVEEIGKLAEHLAAAGVETRPIHIDVAAHSRMVEPILAPFRELVSGLSFGDPQIPYISNVTGTWITPAEVRDPEYWVRHLRGTVRFAEGLGELFREPHRVLLEVGPGQTLVSLARQHRDRPEGQVARPSIRHPKEPESDVTFLLGTLGRLWLAGVNVDWQAFWGGERRRRLPLPTYPFERRSCWLEPASTGIWAGGAGPAVAAGAPASSPLALLDEAVVAREERPERAREYTAPRTDLEARLATLWAELLGIERVGVRDNFFELGGTSLLAVRLGSRLEESLGVELGPHLLITAPTVAQLAEELAKQHPEDSAGAAARTLVTPTMAGVAARQPVRVVLNPGDGRGRPPLFLSHAVGGHLYLYQAVAQALGPDQPVHAFRAMGLGEGEEPLASIEEMADLYISLMREIQPHGPYRLIGSSMGGSIVYEMARRLSLSGEEVPFVAMLDTAGSHFRPVEDLDDDVGMLLHVLRGRIEVTAEELTPLSEEERLTLLADRLRSQELLPGDLGVTQMGRILRVLRANFRAMYAYRPGPLPGRLLYFRAATRRPGDPDYPEIAWTGLAEGGIEIHVVPGDHISMHAPAHHASLVARVRDYLDHLVARGPVMK